MDEWWKCCLNDGGRIHKGEIKGRSGWTRRGGQKLPSQNIRPDEKSCDWSVTKCDFFVFQKYFGLPPFWTCDGNVAYCCVRRIRIIIQWPTALGYTIPNERSPLVAVFYYYYFFLILNRIFLAEKCPFGRFPGFQPGTLWKYQNSNFLILKRIFLAEKSVNNEILGFPTGTLWKYQNSDFSNFEANIFGCELSVRI
jgi:hypothetical protein